MTETGLWKESDREKWRGQWRKHAIPPSHVLPARGSRHRGLSSGELVTVVVSQRENIGPDLDIAAAWLRYDVEPFSRYERLYLFQPAQDDPKRCGRQVEGGGPEGLCSLPLHHPGTCA